MDLRPDDDEYDKKAGIVLMDNENNILFIQQKSNLNWSLPKGSLKKGETYEEGAKREMLEETGIAVSPFQCTKQFYFYQQKVHYIFYIYKMDISRKEIVVSSDDIVGFMWLKKNQFHEKKKTNLVTKLMMEVSF
jgi:8-oxo-dGTP pyrophosphatase MutT (NUDIX family)